MAEKAAGPERSAGQASPGTTPGAPDRTTTARQPGTRDGADQGNEAASAEEARPGFREALERKRAREAGTVGTPPGKDAGKIHGARGPAGHRRAFRRKSG